MGTRGRVSGAALEISTVTPMGSVERPKAPHDLTDEEIVEWVAVVNNEAADHFTQSTLPLLTQYCRHIVGARVAREYRKRAETIANLDKCLAIRESRAARLARCRRAGTTS